MFPTPRRSKARWVWLLAFVVAMELRQKLRRWTA